MLDLAVAAERVLLAHFTLVNTTYLLFSFIAYFTLRRYLQRTWRGDLDALFAGTFYLPVSVLVPAHDEEGTIAANVRALMALRYPEFEVLVINDGSSDATMDVLFREFGLVAVPPSSHAALSTRAVRGVYRSPDHPHLLVVDKENGGKSDALNAGINFASFPLFCSIDADSLLEPDALLRAARLFSADDSVVGVGGIVRVLNGCTVEDGRVTRARLPQSLIVTCQVLDYLRGFLAGRTALSRLSSLLVLSGAFSIFRKDRVVAAGGYSPATVCEDMEIVVRLHRHGRECDLPTRILFAPDPVCWTQVPEDWRSLLAQRDRWQRGLLQTLWLHRRMMLNPRYGAAGMFGFPFYVVFEAFGPAVEALGYVAVVAFAMFGRLDPTFALLFFVLAVLFGMVISLSAVILEDLLFRRYESRRELARLMVAAIADSLGFRQVLAFRRMLSLFTVLSKRDHWGKPERHSIPGGVRLEAKE